LRRCFGLRAGIVTALADNPVVSSNAAIGRLHVGPTQKQQLDKIIAVVEFVTVKAPKSHKYQQGSASTR